MKTSSITELMEDYSKRTSKFCIYISFSENTSTDELLETVPFFEREELEDLIECSTNQQLISIFDTEEEMEECFNQIKDNGIVYAVTCGHGELLDEI